MLQTQPQGPKHPSFERRRSINVTACGKLESGLPDISGGSVSQTICPSTGYMQFRGVSEKDDFPSHLQGIFPDANWPWVQTMEKCCVPSEWAESNGIVAVTRF